VESLFSAYMGKTVRISIEEVTPNGEITCER